MKLYVVSSGFAPFEIDAPQDSTIVNVKHFIMSSVGLETPRANDFQIRFKAITLFDDSTLAQNGVNEHDTVFCLPSELEQQGEPIVIPQLFEQQGVPTVIPSLPQQTPQETLVDHLLDEDADTYMDNNDEFYLSDFTDAPNDDGPSTPILLKKLIIPPDFDENRALTRSEVHHFFTSGQIRLQIKNDGPTWLRKLESYAILSNPSIFDVKNIDDTNHRAHGACALVSSIEYATHKDEAVGHKSNELCEEKPLRPLKTLINLLEAVQKRVDDIANNVNDVQAKMIETQDALYRQAVHIDSSFLMLVNQWNSRFGPVPEAEETPEGHNTSLLPLLAMPTLLLLQQVRLWRGQGGAGKSRKCRLIGFEMNSSEKSHSCQTFVCLKLQTKSSAGSAATVL